MTRAEIRDLMIQLRKWRVLYGNKDAYDPADVIIGRMSDQVDGAPADNFGVISPYNL
jgi:hypothetical protein